MKLSIKNNGKSKFSPEYEFLIDGKPIEGDQLTNISINMPADDIPKVVLTYDIDELDVEDLAVKPYKNLSGLISAVESQENDIKPKGVVVGDQMLCNCLDESLSENLRVGEGVASITAGVIKVADVKASHIPRTDIKLDGIKARTIKAHSTTIQDVDRLAKQIAEQTADEMRRSLK